MLIDVYDFDGTIYDGDSTVDFVRFCLRRHPSLLTGVPGLTGAALRLAAGKSSLTAFKSTLFGLMARRVSLQDEAERFWQDAGTRANLGEWFEHTPRDLPTPPRCWAWRCSSAPGAMLSPGSCWAPTARARKS